MRIDFHAHILPGADHGCSGVEMALQQLAMAREAKVELVVLTPHFYPHKENLDTFLERRARTYQALKDATRGMDTPRLLLGAEIYLCPGLQDLDGLEQLCIGESKTALFEMPREKSRPELFATLDEIREFRGVRPIMAHIDRYEEADVRRLLNMEFPAQLNASSLCKFWRRGKLLQYVKAGQVYALGSDIHGTDIGYREYQKAETVLKPYFADIMEKSRQLLEPF